MDHNLNIYHTNTRILHRRRNHTHYKYLARAERTISFFIIVNDELDLYLGDLVVLQDGDHALQSSFKVRAARPSAGKVKVGFEPRLRACQRRCT